MTERDAVLADLVGSSQGSDIWVKRAILLAIGVVALAVCAKISIPMWPVPISMGTFAVLTIGAAYGPGLGLATILGYLFVGVLGFDVFAKSSAEDYGLAYMMGGTGGYLVGYALAAVALGYFARLGWDRSIGKMSLGLLIGNALIYVPGLLWLGALYGWDKPILEWGLTPFLVGDAIKLALAAMVLPAAWQAVSKFSR